jgi:sortase A
VASDDELPVPDGAADDASGAEPHAWFADLGEPPPGPATVAGASMSTSSASSPASAATGAARAKRRRPSRWDRPKPPRDWRWVVGGIGRALITIGLLMFAFVAYQLWGTGIQTAQAQDDLRHQFDQQMAATTTVDAAVTSTIPVATTIPPSGPAPSTVPGQPAPSTTGTTATTSPSTTTTVALSTAAHPSIGQLVARIEMPTIHVDNIMVEGVTAGALAKGPGHFPESPLPGQLGNAAVAGHRTTHGAPFSDVDQLHPGDPVVFTTPAGRWVYRVTGTEIVASSDYGKVVPTQDPAKATLTLVSCHPKGTASKRIIIHADLDASQSSPVTRAAPNDAAPSTAGLNDEDDPTLTTTATNGTGTVAAGSSSTAVPAPSSAANGTGTSVPGTTTAAAAPATTAAPVAAVEGGGAGGAPTAFEGGWFDDTRAWPHVVLWGLGLIAIWVGCYQLAKRVRRLWVGILVGFAPFVVVLYFWFENVSRLLPPNI